MPLTVVYINTPNARFLCTNKKNGSSAKAVVFYPSLAISATTLTPYVQCLQLAPSQIRHYLAEQYTGRWAENISRCTHSYPVAFSCLIISNSSSNLTKRQSAKVFSDLYLRLYIRLWANCVQSAWLVLTKLYLKWPLIIPKSWMILTTCPDIRYNYVLFFNFVSMLSILTPNY